MNGDIEFFVTKCEGCGEDVTSYWMKDNTGCVSRPEYVLVADWIFHSECWDKVVKDYEEGSERNELVPISVILVLAFALLTALVGCDVARCDPHAIEGVVCPK